MVAYNLRKVENRDRYPDPPFASNRRNSLVAGLRVVAAAAWVRFLVQPGIYAQTLSCPMWNTFGFDTEVRDFLYKLNMRHYLC